VAQIEGREVKHPSAWPGVLVREALKAASGVRMRGPDVGPNCGRPPSGGLPQQGNNHSSRWASWFLTSEFFQVGPYGDVNCPGDTYDHPILEGQMEQMEQLTHQMPPSSRCVATKSMLHL
jgi:hypothetical protein